jgi:hypothetical protein
MDVFMGKRMARGRARVARTNLIKVLQSILHLELSHRSVGASAPIIAEKMIEWEKTES